ncbi:MAG TPA: C25 family cysteine peptidase [Bacteroidales bacterium]|jgi:hypothetical protein|nr:MAG: Lys-gingipain precursor [Bacteroidetes bacterium ADurb.Bin012]HPV34892.1 C25 family cysteine peptidase [Bacteroidales bacterium]HQF18272.1 C25 family cysteine peptidase [Bacteroidales bacterium]HUM54657.1 C25 family cysteine peptidase [Bacteroidales bacterium]
MKNKIFTQFSFLLLFLPLCMFSQQITIHPGGENAFKVLTSDYNAFLFSNQLHTISWYSVSTSQGDFTEIAIPGYGFSNIVGCPKVPVIKKLIEVPLGAKTEVKTIQVEYKEIPLEQYGITHPLIPAQPPVSKQDDPLTVPFVYDAEVYSRDEFLYGEMVRIEEAGMLRSVNIANLEFYPIQYNPVKNVLRVVASAKIQISFKEAQIRQSIDLKKKNYSPYFETSYSQIINYQPLATDELITSCPVTYVIISDPMFQLALQPFIEWKTKKGFQVIAGYTNNPNIGNTTTSIKNYLANLYNNPPAGYMPPSFILLVGDVTQIPAFNGTTGSHATDLRYAEYTGDNLPEVYYGRFSANNLNELQPQIDKTLQYEQYSFPSENFLGEAVMIAGDDAGHMTYSNGQITYGTTNYFNLQHGILSHTYFQPEPTGGNYSQNIIQNISNGVGYANYTAHCSASGWANPSFTISNIPSLQNQDKYPLMVGNCCQSSMYNTTCFAEEIVRAANKGAVGYIGGSDYTYWDEDYWWGCGFKTVSTNPPYDPNHLGAYDVTFHDHGEPSSSWYVTQGQMFVGGNMAVQQSNSSMKAYYWEIYCLMGDPSLMIYYGIPQPIAANYQNTLLIGTDNLTITTEQYAYAALSFEGNLLATGMAEANGTITLNFSPLTNVGNATLIITKQNRKPHIGTIQVIPATGPYLIVQNFTVNDSLGNNNGHADYGEDVFLNVTYKNVGVQSAVNATSNLFTADTNVILTDTSCFMQIVEPNSTFVVRNAFRINIKPKVDDQYNVPLTFSTFDTANIWNTNKYLKLYAPILEIGNLIIDDAITGNGNGVIDPGETVNLILQVSNTGGAVALNAKCSIDIDSLYSNYLMALNPLVNLGEVGIGENKQAFFSVMANIITPPNTTLPLIFKFTAGQMNQYEAENTKEVIIGGPATILMTNGSTNTCNGAFYDSGGPNADYSNNENYVLTFYPGIPGAKVKISFNSFNVEQNSDCSWDYLQIYNGTSTSAPLVGTYCGTTNPPAYTANNVDGVITIKFKSDGVISKPGWSANISCIGGNLTTIASAFPPEICEGASTQLGTLTQGGTGNYSYIWHPGIYLNDSTLATPTANPPASTEFTVEVFDGTSTANASTTVTVHPLPETPTIILQGNMLVSSSPSGNQWNNENGPILGATEQNFIPTETGTYYTIVTSEFGCVSSPSNSLYVEVVGITKIPQDAFFLVFPNPFSNLLNISYTLQNSTEVKIEILNSLGQTIANPLIEQKSEAGSYQIQLNTTSFKPGIYYIRFTTGTSSIVVKALLMK